MMRMTGNDCHCCDGLDIITPIAIANRPGLQALVYRVGTHATFLETMKALLSSSGYPGLAKLRTREGSDPAIAVLDAWAIVADVLTFYQERIANEGYLRTATERRSVLELARLVNYALRPGVAASVYLAFTLETTATDDTVIPVGTRVQSLPGPGELPQSFETAEPLDARLAWNQIKPRLSQPQCFSPLYVRQFADTVYFQGTETNLKKNDLLLFEFEETGSNPELRRVQKVEPQTTDNRTKVTLEPVAQPQRDGFYRLQQVVGAYLEMEAAFCLSAKQGLVQQAIATATSFRNRFPNDQGTLPGAELVAVVQTYMPVLAAQYWAAKAGGYLRLSRWLGEMLTDLRDTFEDSYTYTYELTDEQYDTILDLLNQAVEEPAQPSNGETTAFEQLDRLIAPLLKARTVQPANALRLPVNFQQVLARTADTAPQLLLALQPALRGGLYQAWNRVNVTAPSRVKVHAFRTRASVFGHNAPLRPVLENGTIVDYLDWSLQKPFPQPSPPSGPVITAAAPMYTEMGNVVWLDASYEQVMPNSWVVLERPTTASGISQTVIARSEQVSNRSRSEYGVSGKSTRINLNTNWVNPTTGQDGFQVIRETAVYAQSEELLLAEEPVTVTIGFNPQDPEQGKRLELDGLYDGLKPGRWVVVAGDRADVPGVRTSELVMIASIAQDYDPALPGDTTHTILTLVNDGLAYSYKRDTVGIYANVVKATHGETRTEVLGSGNGSQAFQQFPLRQKPLTYLSAPTAAGAASTLQVRVNDILWHEMNTLAGLASTDRNFITRTDDEGNTNVVFGNGTRGARLPSGVENVNAVYRSGIGKVGNVKAEQISLLATRPLGVKSAVNPLPATGGADPESRDQARRNASLAVMALDRLVSVQDYADFARTFAGIGKASAQELSDGQRQLVHLTVAGADDIPISSQSDLYRNLLEALRQLGDPHQALKVEVREQILLIINAQVQLLPDYLWEAVATQMRTALFDAFSFNQRDLGQDVYLSEIISTIQQVPGVAYVDVDAFGGVSEKAADGTPRSPKQIGDEIDVITGRRQVGTESFLKWRRRSLSINAIARRTGVLPVNLATLTQGAIRPAQIAYLSPDVPATLTLTERKP